MEPRTERRSSIHDKAQMMELLSVRILRHTIIISIRKGKAICGTYQKESAILRTRSKRSSWDMSYVVYEAPRPMTLFRVDSASRTIRWGYPVFESDIERFGRLRSATNSEEGIKVVLEITHPHNSLRSSSAEDNSGTLL